MNIEKIKQTILYLFAIGLSLSILFYIVLGVWIGHETRSLCDDAQGEYAGDCVEALIALLEDESRGYKARNRAVWSLGQFGDGRALPALQKYYTGEIPDREPLDETLSQYELKKAINLVEGGTNIAAFIWRQSL